MIMYLGGSKGYHPGKGQKDRYKCRMKAQIGGPSTQMCGVQILQLQL